MNLDEPVRCGNEHCGWCGTAAQAVHYGMTNPRCPECLWTVEEDVQPDVIVETAQ